MQQSKNYLRTINIQNDDTLFKSVEVKILIYLIMYVLKDLDSVQKFLAWLVL
ncbi:hypothetical protein SAMN04488027_102129 [Psychroflexus sediminis]|uniref:Uncharacterized protein n=1 Tax=Psychroflexus sediminis TaxID=470826 RepID=A0A1G7UKQ5_9FLAO|nr:hypothetical protein SAMN04488027_102129 [Psychroflexus sediminis]